MPDTDKIKPPSCWVPMQASISLALLGKLAEELNEAGSAVARCIIQGPNERDPETGEKNIDWLEKELSDVEALTQLAIARFRFDRMRMLERREKKMAHKQGWFKLLFEKYGWE